MARVKQQKTRQMLLETSGPSIDPFTLPERLQLFDANGDPADLSAFVGVPEGGNAGQVLGKASSANHDLDWLTGGGGGGIAIFEQLTAPEDAPIGSIWIEQEPAEGGVVPIDPTGWDVLDEPAVEFSPTEGIILTLDSHDPPDALYTYAYSPPFVLGEEFEITVRVNPPTSTDVPGSKDVEYYFYLWNDHQDTVPPRNWKSLDFDWYLITGDSTCKAYNKDGSSVGITPNPIIEIDDTPWLRWRVADGVAYWEVSEDGAAFTELGNAVWAGRSSDVVMVELDCYGNSEGNIEDWWDPERLVKCYWNYLKINDDVIFNNASLPAPSAPNVFINSSHGWVPLT